MKILEHKAVFDTGKEIPVFCGTIGLDPDLNITSGYDDGIHTFEEHTCYHQENLTRSELLELADYMIFQWMNLRSKAEAMEKE